MSKTQAKTETGDPQQLSTAEAVATMCLFRTSDQTQLKRDLEPGTYEVDTTIRVFGSLKKEKSKPGIIHQKSRPVASLCRCPANAQ